MGVSNQAKQEVSGNHRPANQVSGSDSVPGASEIAVPKKGQIINITVNVSSSGDLTIIKEGLAMANAALDALKLAVGKMQSAVQEVKGEVADLKTEFGNTETDKAAIQAEADKVLAAAQELSDINPNTPAAPPAEPA